ncbi:hypothetical protein [Acidithiobacillus ferrooxidans]|uniref:hypothetical protein n=1 Tax=Acidithiobacillus ferrooxidans TaxID=920 RepID=UPI0012D90F3C|nr:hypothetical protein [Acidithiobacillus ferrooxidans]MCR1342963.1 hypothetical protein [Acidithiobacillus ferrooxidans]QZT53354.1 hypothetical protein K7B00_03915 [Acidithiobacillus ferrooxidans]
MTAPSLHRTDVCPRAALVIALQDLGHGDMADHATAPATPPNGVRRSLVPSPGH